MKEQSNQTLRIEINAEWTADDFAKTFTALDELYSMRAMIQIEEESIREMVKSAEGFYPIQPVGRMWFRSMVRGPGLGFPAGIPQFIDSNAPDRTFGLLKRQERLQVRRIQFASPGQLDLTGIAPCIMALTPLIIFLIKTYISAPQRKLENEQRAADLEAKRLKNARDFLDLQEDGGRSNIEMRNLHHYVDERQLVLIRLFESGKIRSAKVIDDKAEKEPKE